MRVPAEEEHMRQRKRTALAVAARHDLPDLRKANVSSRHVATKLSSAIDPQVLRDIRKLTAQQDSNLRPAEDSELGLLDALRIDSYFN